MAFPPVPRYSGNKDDIYILFDWAQKAYKSLVINQDVVEVALDVDAPLAYDSSSQHLYLDVDGVTDGYILTVSSGAAVWAANAAGGDVQGPSSATVNEIAVFNAVTGKEIRRVPVLIDTLGNISTVNDLSMTGTLTVATAFAGAAFLDEDTMASDSATKACSQQSIKAYVDNKTYSAGSITGFTEAAQDAVGAMVDATLVYVDATPLLQRAALTGDVTASAGSNATTIANDAVTFGKMQNITTDRLIGRDTASSGDPEEITVGGGLEFTGSGGIQRSALTGDVTASAGSNATTLTGNAGALQAVTAAPPVEYVDVTVTAAEMLALDVTPKTIVAAPGANKMLFFEGAVFKLVWNSAAFAGIAAGDDMGIRYTNTTGLYVGGIETTGFLDQTADTYRMLPPYGPILWPNPASTLVNAPLVLYLVGPITTGDSDLKVRVFYRTIDLTTL